MIHCPHVLICTRHLSSTYGIGYLKPTHPMGASVFWRNWWRMFGCRIKITMLRSTFGLLLVGLVTVSTVPLNEPATELLPSQTTTKTITLEDVENDSAVEAIRAFLSICSMDYPSSQEYRKSMENALENVMKKKNFSAFTDEFLKNITTTRKAECQTESDPNQFTGRNSERYIMLRTYVVQQPEAQTSTENNQEPPAVQRIQEPSGVQKTQELEQNDLGAKLNDFCDVDGPCHLLPHSQCMDSKCSCERTHFERDGKCLPGLGALCTNHDGCALKNLTCVQGICSCEGRYSPLSKICRKWPTKLNDFCHEALPCTRIENSHCTTAGCVCRDQYIEQNGRCVPGLNAPCTNAADCHAVPNFICISGKCA